VSDAVRTAADVLRMTRPADDAWMRLALDAARDAAAAGEVPVGAVIVRDGSLVACDSNRTLRDQDASAHAEMLALRAASRALGAWRLEGCSVYVTLEPCAMCAGALVLARVDRVVFGAWDEKAGMAGSVGELLRHPRLNHRPEARAGVLSDDCARLVEDFFRSQRSQA